jgi:hypothetical protein
MKGAMSLFTSSTPERVVKFVRMTPPSSSIARIASSGEDKGTRRKAWDGIFKRFCLCGINRIVGRLRSVRDGYAELKYGYV